MSTKVKKRKTKSSKRNKSVFPILIMDYRSMNKASLKDKEEFNLSALAKNNNILFNTVEAPQSVENLFQTASSCTRLQYLNKTFGDFKVDNMRYQAKPAAHLKKSSNILKYKKYMKPLMSSSKFGERAASPINISIKGKLSKSTKASTDFLNLHKKTPSACKMYNAHMNSINLVTTSSFHNNSVLGTIKSKKVGGVKPTHARKVGNMSILDKTKAFNPSSAHQKKKTTLTGYTNRNYLTSPRRTLVHKKPHNYASSRMEVINLNKDQGKAPRKSKPKKLYGSNIVLNTKNTMVSNEIIAAKKAKLLKPTNRSKDGSNFGSFEESMQHPLKIQGAYQIKPKRSRKKTNLSSTKFKNNFTFVNYPAETTKSRKSSRKSELKSNSHLKTKSIMSDLKLSKPTSCK